MARAIVDVKSISETPTGLDLWNRLEFTDKDYTKKVDRGGFSGTAVDPVYNLKRVTQELGPVGFAWGWKVLNERLDIFGTGDDAVTMHSLTVRAWFAQEDGSVREVDHIGHTKVSYRTRGQNARWIVDEEFGKKSLTDALSKIMMSLGASADIWLGRFDGNKYVPPQNDDEPAKVAKPRKLETTGLSPSAAVDAALSAQGADPTDPWSIGGIDVKDLVKTLADAIAKKPWPEVEKLAPQYVQRLGLTEHERAQVRKAFTERKRAETPATAAG